MSTLTPIAAQTAHVVVQAACVTPNNMLSAPLTPIVGQLTGALVQVMLPLAILVAAVLFVIGIVTVATNRGSGHWRNAGIVLVAVPGFILLLVIGTAIYHGIATTAQC